MEDASLHNLYGKQHGQVGNTLVKIYIFSFIFVDEIIDCID
jgi:hypothetical protein